jgi:FkbM family methyltransferase
MDPIGNYIKALHAIGVLNWQDQNTSGESSFLKSYLASFFRPVVLDIGAYHGDYAHNVLEICPSASVYAFEPHPVTYEILETSGKASGFKTFNYGLGRQQELTSIYDYHHQDGSEHASIYKKVIEDLHTGAAIKHSIQLEKLDDVLNDLGLSHVDLLKIDTEGNEFNVLIGAENSIRNGMISVIHFEFNEMNVISRTFFKDFFDFLPEYDFFRLTPNGAIHIQTYKPALCEIFAYQNIVCTRKTSMGY